MTNLSSWTSEQVASRLSGSGKKKAKRTRDGWMVCCPAHDDGTPSLSLSDRNGRLLWHCFGGCDGNDVRKAIEGILGGEIPEKRENSAAPVNKERAEERYTTIYPVPEDAYFTMDDFQHSIFGAPTGFWTYRLETGQIAGWVARYDLPDGKKEYSPYVWGRDEKLDRELPIKRSMPEPRPLYNLDKLAANPDAPVIFSEGEKSADAAAILFPEWVSTSLPGGANASRMVDLSPLSGRLVIALPDHDANGYELLLNLWLRAPHNTDLRMLVWPDNWPADEHGEVVPYTLNHGDDAADHIIAGWTTDKLRQAVAESGRDLVHRIEELPDPFELSHRR